MSRWMRLLLSIGLIAGFVAGGIWLGQQVMADPGYVLFAVGGYAVEMSFWVFLLCMIVLTLLIWVITGIVLGTGRMPLVLWRALGSARRDRADRRVAEGALWLQRGQPDRALTLLTKEGVADSAPAVHWILAAMAAKQVDQPDAVERYLQRAEALMRQVPKPVIAPAEPTGFAELKTKLKKHWTEEWVLLAMELDCTDPLARLRAMHAFEKQHSESPMLALVQAKLARLAGLEAEASHYRSKAEALAPNDPRVLLESLEAACGPHPSIQRLAENVSA